jgi:hypothetical protein
MTRISEYTVIDNEDRVRIIDIVKSKRLVMVLIGDRLMEVAG